MDVRPLLLAASLLAGCVVGERRREPELRHGSGLPDPQVVASAVERLEERVREELDDDHDRGWPEHLPRSRDFPELPLVRVEQAEDLGRTGADMDALTRALEHELRRVRLVRLSTDEESVPGWLREGEPDEGGGPPTPPARGAEVRKPGLQLKSWTDRAGRLVLELRDLITDDRVARVRSR